MNALILPEAERMRQALYAQIATITSARDVHALARSLSAIDRAVILITTQPPPGDRRPIRRDRAACPRP